MKQGACGVATWRKISAWTCFLVRLLIVFAHVVGRVGAKVRLHVSSCGVELHGGVSEALLGFSDGLYKVKEI